MEDLREHCLYEELKAENKTIDWWKYMKYVHSICYEYVTEDCSKSGHKEIGRSFEKTSTCVKNTFTGSNINKDDNTVLSDMAQEWKKFGTGYWPSIVINNRTFRGDLTPDHVMTALCSGFADSPVACGGADGTNTIIIAS